MNTTETKPGVLYDISLKRPTKKYKFHVICSLETRNPGDDIFAIHLNLSNWEHRTFTVPLEFVDGFEIIEIGTTKDHPEYLI